MAEKSEDFNSEEVILEIENTSIKCNKQDLIKHSDYFKAMFEGNFIERNKRIIKLEVKHYCKLITAAFTL